MSTSTKGNDPFCKFFYETALWDRAGSPTEVVYFTSLGAAAEWYQLLDTGLQLTRQVEKIRDEIDKRGKIVVTHPHDPKKWVRISKITAKTHLWVKETMKDLTT